MKGMLSRLSDLAVSAVALGGLAAGLSACGSAGAAASHPATPTSVRVATESATPTATQKATASQKPKAAAGPALLVVSAVGYSGIRPVYIDFSGDAGDVVTHISWSSWTATRAAGTGTSDVESCVPDCADGSVTAVSTSIVLSDPVNGKFTAIDESRDGSNYTGWPIGAGQNIS